MGRPSENLQSVQIFWLRICNLNCGFGLFIFMGSSSFDWLFYNLLNDTSVRTSIFLDKTYLELKMWQKETKTNIILFFSLLNIFVVDQTPLKILLES